MKNIFLFCFLFFFTGVLVAQNDTGKITYTLSPPTLKQFQDTTGLWEERQKEVLRQYKNIRETAPLIRLTLYFNPEEAVFQRTDKNYDQEDHDFNATLAKAMALGSFYMNTKKNEQIHRYPHAGQTWLIQKKLDDLNWKITEAKKKITGYSCQKAITRNPSQNYQVKKSEITAWFCPEISGPYGPIGYNGLPGVILELTWNDFTFKAEKADLNNNKKFKLNRPRTGKPVTVSKFREILMEVPPPPPRPKYLKEEK